MFWQAAYEASSNPAVIISASVKSANVTHDTRENFVPSAATYFCCVRRCKPMLSADAVCAPKAFRKMVFFKRLERFFSDNGVRRIFDFAARNERAKA